jgi:hypothetical protein
VRLPESRPLPCLDRAQIDDIGRGQLPEHRVEREAGDKPNSDAEGNEAARLLRADLLTG